MTEPVCEYATRRPAPPLRPFVEEYAGYRLQGYPAGIHRGLPGRHLTFIISLGDPVDIAAMPDPAHPPVSTAAFVSGLTEGPATIVHDGRQHGVSVDLTPLGARALLGLPAAKLAATVVELDAVMGRDAARLCDRLASASTWSERFDVLDAVLAAAAGRVQLAPPRAEVVHAWHRLVAAGGSIPVGSLASELGWSRRHLGERFRTEIGLAPKAVARVVRFERARRLLERPEGPGLAQVAAIAGYYDQAHLNREWRSLAGCSPTTWMAEELPSVRSELDGGGWNAGGADAG